MNWASDKFEIDMLSIGDADAITIRHFITDGSTEKQHVTVIDGGKEEHTSQLVKHLDDHYGSTHINLMVISHWDADHVGGLIAALMDKEITVDKIWMHDPIVYYDKNSGGMIELMEGSVAFRTYLYNNGMWEKWVVPTVGMTPHGPFEVLGPSDMFLEKQRLGYIQDKLPSLKTEQLKKEAFTKFGELALDKAGDDESKINNMSIIIKMTTSCGTYLFTGDAGTEAIENAISEEIYWLKVPHHGSEKNLTSDLIRNLKPKIAYISAAGSQDPQHPSRSIVFALRKFANAEVYSTHIYSGGLCHLSGLPIRKGWVKAEEVWPGVGKEE